MSNFLITIDTEGDDIWSGPKDISTNNAQYLPRFQALCEKYTLKPTYLVNYEMACDSGFLSLGRDVIARDAGEIGMHLHAWNSPPIVTLTDDDFGSHPYLIEYPKNVMRRKIEFLTKHLEDTFETKMLSHRAGRWAFSEYYAEVLRDLGYKTDCSVTPHVDWSRTPGAPGGRGGTDYRGFPEYHYWMSATDIALPGTSKGGLLEVPMTILDRCPRSLVSMRNSLTDLSGLARRAANRMWPVQWLRPNGRNLESMLKILDRSRNRAYVEFMLHSSEFMPGGSPYFPDAESIEKLYSDLDILFAHACARFRGATLNEFHERVWAQSKNTPETLGVVPTVL